MSSSEGLNSWLYESLLFNHNWLPPHVKTPFERSRIYWGTCSLIKKLLFFVSKLEALWAASNTAVPAAPVADVVSLPNGEQVVKDDIPF